MYSNNTNSHENVKNYYKPKSQKFIKLYFYIVFVWTMDQYHSSLKRSFGFKIIFHLYRIFSSQRTLILKNIPTTIIYVTVFRFFLNSITKFE